MTTEYCEEWHPVDGIPESFLEASISMEGSAVLSVVLTQGIRLATGVSNGPDLLLEFNTVLGVQVYDELHHPDLGAERPRSPSGLAFPCVIWRESEWSSGLNQVFTDGLIHYQVITAGPIVDILSTAPPSAKWVPVSDGQ
jgi:hypothetical protein